jgi:hypothetical protein
VETVSGLPRRHDIDANYSPQYVQLARIIRDKIESGEYRRMDAVSAAGLAGSYGVSIRVAYATLAMLAANRYVRRIHVLGPIALPGMPHTSHEPELVEVPDLIGGDRDSTARYAMLRDP